MNLDPSNFIGPYRDGLRTGFKSLIDSVEFPISSATQEPSKSERSAQEQLCREHVVTLIEAQDGGTVRPERTLDERQRQYKSENQ